MEENELILICVKERTGEFYLEIWNFAKEIHTSIKELIFYDKGEAQKAKRCIESKLSILIIRNLFFPKGKGKIVIDIKMREIIDSDIQNFIDDYVRKANQKEDHNSQK